MISRDLIRQEFPVSNDYIYMNHAAVSPWPQRTATAIGDFCEENTRRGAARYPEWIATEQTLRARAASLIDCDDPDDIALVKNTSEGLSMVAYGLDFPEGSNIVALKNDFPSNVIVWQSLEDRGVEVRLVDCWLKQDPEQAIIDACDSNTRLLAVSSVHFSSGLRLALEKLGTYCRQHGLLFCVDAIQSLGVLPFSVSDCHADFVIADGHKWMMGPEGLAVFYSRPEIRHKMKVHEFGWHMTENMYDFDAVEWKPACSGRRFECGSPNMTVAHGLNKSLELLLETGIDVIAEKILDNTGILFRELEKMQDITLLSPASRMRQSGIISFLHQRHGSGHIYQWLTENRVICSIRGGAIRLSPHFYNSENEIEQLIRLLRDLEPEDAA